MASTVCDTRVAPTDPPANLASDVVSPPPWLDPTRAPMLSVILVGQRSLAGQRRGRFVAGSGAHPARMAPDLAAHLGGPPSPAPTWRWAAARAEPAAGT